MPILNQGGSLVTSDNIVDGSILNADVNTAAAIAQAKIAGHLNNDDDIIRIETTSGSTHSLVTSAGERVFVLAKGDTQLNGAPNPRTITLDYNSVVKDSVTAGENSTDSAAYSPFCLAYTEVPGAATANIVVTGTSLSNVKIFVLILKA